MSTEPGPAGQFVRGIREQDIPYRATFYTVVLLFLTSTLVPFGLVFLISISQPGAYFEGWVGIPSNITFENWINGFNSLKDNLINSFLIAAGVTVISMVVTIPSAYAFGRKEFPGRKVLFYTIIIAMMFPYILLVLPIADVWIQMGLYNTLPGLWIAYQVFVTPFAIWILRDYFQKLPRNIEEAAMVYGCTEVSAFYRVILPLATPAIVAVGFLAFLTGWNDFLFSNFLTLGGGPIPAVVELYQLVNSGSGEKVRWGALMAQVFIVGLPPTALYIMARRYLTDAFAFE
jgi:multiple sugar transport system permease protein